MACQPIRGAAWFLQAEFTFGASFEALTHRLTLVVTNYGRREGGSAIGCPNATFWRPIEKLHVAWPFAENYNLVHVKLVRDHLRCSILYGIEIS